MREHYGFELIASISIIMVSYRADGLPDGINLAQLLRKSSSFYYAELAFRIRYLRSLPTLI